MKKPSRRRKGQALVEYCTCLVISVGLLLCMSPILLNGYADSYNYAYSIGTSPWGVTYDIWEWSFWLEIFPDFVDRYTGLLERNAQFWKP